MPLTDQQKKFKAVADALQAKLVTLHISDFLTDHADLLIEYIDMVLCDECEQYYLIHRDYHDLHQRLHRIIEFGATCSYLDNECFSHRFSHLFSHLKSKCAYYVSNN